MNRTGTYYVGHLDLKFVKDEPENSREREKKTRRGFNNGGLNGNGIGESLQGKGVGTKKGVWEKRKPKPLERTYYAHKRARVSL